MTMAGAIQFQGSGPFDLPVAQRATATPGSDAVTLTFHILANPSQMEAVRIAVLNSQALAFAAAIARAAASGEAPQ
jgi:hypothetical protein